MAKNPFERYETVAEKHLQVVYLYSRLKLTAKKVAEITGYAVSTVKTYARKFVDLLETATAYFEKPFDSVVKVLCPSLGKVKAEKCYLFKFYDNANNLLFSKIGTTTRAIKARLKEEIKAYRKGGFEIGKVEICEVIDCGELPAEGAESICRAEFIRQYKGTFKKNDRFMGVDIPTADFCKIVYAYLT